MVIIIMTAKADLIAKIREQQDRYSNTCFGSSKDRYDAMSDIGKLFQQLRALDKR